VDRSGWRALRPARSVDGRSSGWSGVSTTTRTTVKGRPRAEATRGNDSMSTVVTPSAANRVSVAAPAMRSTVAIGPTTTAGARPSATVTTAQTEAEAETPGAPGPATRACTRA